MIPNKKNNNNITINKKNLSVDGTDNAIKKNSTATTTTATSLSYQLFKNRRFNKLNGKLLEPVASTVLKLDGDNSHISSMVTTPADDVSSSTTAMKAMNKPPDCLGNVLDKVKALKRSDDR
jgi:hypothetical protein